MKKLIISSLLLALLLPLAAQEPSYSGYFMKSANYTHLLNPSFAPEHGYVNIPVLGNLNLDINSNVLLKNFLYPSSDGTVLYSAFNRNVSSDEFLSKLRKENYMDIDLRTSILSAGFFVGENFFSLDIGINASAGANIPKEFFSFVKNGMVDGKATTYNLENMSVQSYSFANVSLGYSRDILENLRVGGSFKFLFGLERVNETFERMTIQMSPNEWTIDTKTTLEGYLCGLEFKKNDKGNVVGFNYDAAKFGLSGFGFAFDLGAEYSPVQNLNLSLSALNLGGIFWKQESALKATSSGTFSYAGFKDINVSGNDIKKQAEDIKESFNTLASLKASDVEGSSFKGIGPTLIAGAEYCFFENRLSAGLVFSEEFSSIKNYSRLMASCNYRPGKSFELSGSFSFLDAGGKSFGIAVNVFDVLFLACDHVFWNVTPQMLPVNTSTTSLQVGLNVPLYGNRRND